MPTIRDLVGAIRQREGVEAAVVLGRDGLLIDGEAIAQLDAENVAAHVPSIITAADDFGAAAGRGPLTTAVPRPMTRPARPCFATARSNPTAMRRFAWARRQAAVSKAMLDGYLHDHIYRLATAGRTMVALPSALPAC